MIPADESWAIVDTHQHLQSLSDASYPWLDPERPEPLEGDLGPIRRDYLPADYRRDMEGLGVVKTVHIQNGRNPYDPVDETRWLSALARKEGMPDAIVAYADLAAPDVERVLEAHAGFPRVRGIRQILNWHDEPRLRSAPSPDLMESPQWRRGFARLAPLGLSFDLQLYWPQMDMALALARAFPDTAIVLEHFGIVADRGPEGVAAWQAAISRLAQAPNVSVKLCGFGLGARAWTPEDTLPLLHYTLKAFGPTRTMVGTNIPVDLLFATPKKVVSIIHAVAMELSHDERIALLRSNAERFYRI
ncbi:Predicted metal-dependent hydrolase, TIM-barrel fold [Mesorhizobium sp. NFR06]|uniref:amidohydrolase family protein n=1 Tax=Mesorhizobium sp. NFR06 TaxID=1566290 RepID=UPI0008E5F349|nr:amidohydrolase family protein [Mesorhizobium sp. NFR06]SFQ08896.1 Predicted metal-dependent hydrolase, TIM-barrel fold [Mesorhizobium sp. NFR06]